MERERRIFRGFLDLHARKASTTERPAAHMQFWSEGLGVDEPLLLMDEEDLLGALDVEASPVRWLLHQLRTYDPARQKIVGLIFDRKTVLSDVLWVVRGCESA